LNITVLSNCAPLMAAGAKIRDDSVSHFLPSGGIVKTIFYNSRAQNVSAHIFAQNWGMGCSHTVSLLHRSSALLCHPIRCHPISLHRHVPSAHTTTCATSWTPQVF